MHLVLPLNDWLEKQALAIAVRLANKNKVCPRCQGHFTLSNDIVASVTVRLLVYCVKCGWWIAKFEALPSDYRNARSTADNEWPPPLATPPAA